MVIGLVTVTWMMVVELTSDEAVLLVEALAVAIEDDTALMEMSALFDESVVIKEVDANEVVVGRQEQADEIRDGSPEQCETKVGRPVVTVLSAVV